MVSLSIVILNYNGRHFLAKFLPTVIKHSENCDIVVADNNSDDDSVSYLKSTFPKIRLIELDQNYGFCGGYNKALFQLEAEYFILLNSDIEVTEKWTIPIIRMFEMDDRIAAIQPKLLDFNHKDKFEYAGGAGGYIDKFGYPFCRGRIFDTIEIDHGQYNDECRIFWASGAAIAIKAELFKSYGGFDEDFFAHMEEIDLCWRLQRDGQKIMYCPDSVIYHVGGGTLAYSNPQKTYLNFRNSLLVLIKNLPLHQMPWKIMFRIAMDYVAAIKFILTGQFRDAAMIIKAQLYIAINLKKTLKKRPKKIKPLGNLSGIYPKFLLFQYHIARVRKFSNLRF
jgi:GT2 family glycosyltransferase